MMVLLPVNFVAMAECDQVKNVIRQVKVVNHPVISGSQPVFRSSLQSLVGKLIQPQTQFADFG